jgi:uncharacterized RDD family membrane protein YckC
MQAVAGHPERSLQGMRAGFVSRLVAAVIDAVVIVALWFGILVTVAVAKFLWRPVRGVRLDHLPILGSVTALVLLAIVVLTVGWATTGRTIGKRMAGLRLITNGGGTPPWPVAFVRAVLYVVWPVGLVWALFSTKNRSLQDIVVRTAVVYDWGTRLPSQ